MVKVVQSNEGIQIRKGILVRRDGLGVEIAMKYICQTCEKPKVEAEIIRDNYNDEYICQTCYDEKKKEEQEEQEAFETESKLEPRKHELSGAIDSRKNFDFKWLFYILLVALLVSLAYLLLSGTLATILRGI